MKEPDTEVTLKDGARIYLRTVGSCDRKCILDGFAQLSARSRYSRYHTSMSRLPEGYLDGLANADNLNNVVVIAHLTKQNPDRGVGLGRYVRLVDEDGVAEFSITVIDEYQNRGLGAALLDYLIKHAWHNHVLLLRGYVLSSNEQMIGLLRRYSCPVQTDGNGTLCYEIDTSSCLPDKISLDEFEPVI